MNWESPYLIALYDAILVPAVIIIFGLLMEWLTNGITFLFGKVFGQNVAFFIRNRLTFIGTVHHELAHAILAFLSRAKVTKVELFKVRGNQLGCVEFVPRGLAFSKAIQMTLVSIAPVICGAGSLCILSWTWVYVCKVFWQYLIVGYLFVSILFHMNMSTQDLKNALKGMPVIILICYLVFLVSGITLVG